MFEEYFTEFYVSEEELKDQIYSILKSLNAFEPQKFPVEVLEYANSKNPSHEIVTSLADSIPDLSSLRLALPDLQVDEALRLTAISLTIELNYKRLAHLFTKQLFMTHSTFFLGIQYLLVSEVLSE